MAVEDNVSGTSSGERMMRWTGTQWVELGSPVHAREQRLLEFLWDHAALALGEEESFRKSSYGVAEGDCEHCGARKHFSRRDAAATKEIHLRGYFTTMREKYPSLTLDYLEELWNSLTKAGEHGGSVAT